MSRLFDGPQFRRVVQSPAATVEFTLDGIPVRAVEGDLLITAILTHRGYLRHFEFGPSTRAGFCMMAACQDCWVSLADGRRVRSCSTLVEAGMAVVIDGAVHDV